MKGELLLVWVLAGAALAQNGSNLVFEAKKQEYLRTEGADLLMNHERVWAWLEKLKLNQINASTYYVKDVDGVSRPVGQVISKLIRCWGTRGYEWPPPYPPYGYAWNWAQWTTSASLIWILLKYDNAISSSDKLFLQTLFESYIADKNFSPGSENSQIHDMVGRYLYAQYRQDVGVQYSYYPAPNQNIIAFSWRGRSYVPGSIYKAYALARDWIQYNMDLWVRLGNRELDSPAYTLAFVHAFCALYECAIDPEMKRMAQMMVDFLLLESVMDYSAKHWGGALGRSYVNTYEGRTQFYWDFFWNFQSTAYNAPYDVLMSSYRLPNVIWDAGDLNDEPDKYYHINMENSRLVEAPGTGKWTYVTKFFNLGGRISAGWILNIKSDDTPGSYNKPGVPFTLWINTFVGGQGTSYPAPNQAYPTPGEWGYQYKNAMFIRSSQLHLVTSPNTWDADQTDGMFRYLKEGRTMVAIGIVDSLDVAGLEVDIEGVDYANFEQFKYAVRTRCNLNRWEFTTSKGDVVSWDKWPATGDWTAVVKKAGSTKYEFVWNFPFQRIQTVDYRNQVIVHWEGMLMIVKRHGVQRTYDFNNWTVSETSGAGDPVAPNPPQGVGVTVK
jgi:hypothetical protein